ncbi:MAG: hypothetical protein KY468_00265 [Armatimonadetes bacterium]|nr:hypothetical protein [Armatimonadota bacterium]
MPKGRFRSVALLCSSLLTAASLAAAEPVTVTVDGSKPQQQATGAHYSLNLYKGPDPKFPFDPRYRSNLSYMRAPLLRIHNGAMCENAETNPFGWVNEKDRTWDEAKVRSVLSGLSRLDYPHELLLNIPTWPGWMKSENGLLHPSEHENFARFCARLVTLVNKETPGRFVRYWEPINEKDLQYSRAGKMDELTQLWKKCATAMRKADRRVKVGGLAFQQPNLTANVRAFINGAAKEMDFLSMHAYVSGSKDDPTAAIFDRTDSIAAYQRDAVEYLAKRTRRKVPVFLDEYNISWNPPDPRMNNHIGTVFDALIITKSIEAGSGGTMAWNEMDGWYGKTDNSFNRRPSADLFHLLNHFFVGRTVAVRSSHPDVKPFAVLGKWTPAKEPRTDPEPDLSLKSILWINRGSVAHSVSTQFKGVWPPLAPSRPLLYTRISSSGVTTDTITYGELQVGIHLPEESVTLLTFRR